MLRSNDNCYVSGWGISKYNYGVNPTKEKLKYLRVSVVPAANCKTSITDNDEFVQTMEPDSNGYYPIICAEGHKDTEGRMSNTCGGDSGKLNSY